MIWISFTKRLFPEFCYVTTDFGSDFVDNVDNFVDNSLLCAFPELLNVDNFLLFFYQSEHFREIRPEFRHFFLKKFFIQLAKFNTALIFQTILLRQRPECRQTVLNRFRCHAICDAHIARSSETVRRDQKELIFFRSFTECARIFLRRFHE